MTSNIADRKILSVLDHIIDQFSIRPDSDLYVDLALKNLSENLSFQDLNNILRKLEAEHKCIKLIKESEPRVASNGDMRFTNANLKLLNKDKIFELKEKLSAKFDTAKKSNRGAKLSNLNEVKCTKWLKSHVSKGKPKAPKFSTKDNGLSYYDAALKKFPELGKNQFIRAWEEATANAPEWGKAGKPKVLIKSIDELIQ